MIRAAVYCRVSSEIQKERASIETQRQFAVQYCKAQGIEIVEIFADDGVSGTVPLHERPEGARMLQSAKAKRFSVLLVFRLDRLARSTMDILRTVELLKESEIVIRSLTEPFETETATGKFLLSMLASVAELERDGIADRTRAGMERHAREGRWLGGRAPFGYQVVDRRLAINPEQSEIVRDIFTWYLSGQRTRAIAARLNAAGIKHPTDWNKPTSRLWWESTVAGVLHGRHYIGEWEWRKRTDRRKVHGKTTFTVTPPEQRIAVSIPPLISVEDFDRVQEIMKENFTFASRNTKYPYLLRALIMCGECGRRYIGLGSGRPRWYKHFYRCSSHVSAAGRVPCAGKAIRADYLDAAVWEQCFGFISNPGPLLDELRAAMSFQQLSQGDIRAEVGQMESALLVKTKERARVITLIRRGVISDAEGDTELALLGGEVAQLQQRRDALLSRKADAEDRELRVLTAEAMLTLLADKAANADFDQRREIVCAFVNGVTMRTIENKPIAEVCYIFQPSLSEALEGVSSVDVALATSSARFTESWPRTSRKSTL